MFQIHLHWDDQHSSYPFEAGKSLFSLFETAGIEILSDCGGTGTCGLCLVQILAGELPAPNPIERKHLTKTQLAQNIRLACQLSPKQEVSLRILSRRAPVAWRNLKPREVPDFQPNAKALEHWARGTQKPQRLGVAIDLGTTHLCLSLWDLSKGQRLAGRVGLNPQFTFGSDIMTRLAAASTEQTAKAISRITRAAIAEGLKQLVKKANCKLYQIEQLLIVGNTAMLVLLSGRKANQLLDPNYWAQFLDCQPLNTHAWAKNWGLAEGCIIELLPPLAGFVGSDLLAGLLATQLDGQTGGALLVDFGTNSEIALWDGKSLWVTSAAGGPAFEGSGISCGMPAGAGAAWRAEIKAGEKEFSLEVIGKGELKGISGSALVDIIAGLVKTGRLRANGLFHADLAQTGLKLAEKPREIILQKRDIDLFQRAKAAVGAGIVTLLQKSGLQKSALEQIYISGAFGSFLQVESAQQIGLIPELDPGKVKLCGNTALGGCEQQLFAANRQEKAKALKQKIRYFNLAQHPEFESLFFENLFLRPMKWPEGERNEF